MKFILKLLPIFILAILVVIFFNKTLTGQQIFVTPDFGRSDILHYEYPTKLFLSESLKNGHLPLWNSLITNGYPQIATINGYFNPLNLIIFFLFPMPLAFNLGFALSFLIIGTFTYLFTRSMGLSKIASLLGAISFSYSGIFVTQIVHFNVIQTLAFSPMELYLTEIYIHKNFLSWRTALLQMETYSWHYCRNYRRLINIGDSTLTKLGINSNVQS